MRPTLKTLIIAFGAIGLIGFGGCATSGPHTAKPQPVTAGDMGRQLARNGAYLAASYYLEKQSTLTPGDLCLFEDLINAQIRAGRLLAAQRSLYTMVSKWPNHQPAKALLSVLSKITGTKSNPAIASGK